jgi:hypothetical protein
VINKGGLQVENSKIEAILRWPKPKNLKALRGFLGLVSYYMRFIKDFGKISFPFQTVLTKQGFH